MVFIAFRIYNTVMFQRKEINFHSLQQFFPVSIVLIEYRNGDNEEDKWTFLYDIKNDPWETKNLASDENYKDMVNEMREKIIKHRDEWEEQSHPWGVDFWNRF